mmetsp:Transcript_68096/g.215444  ORF Transcript_68096/g.215444 Transcript_68096/m.215444 type:complete len:216 (-) Transcript_68096:56-703(-)
MSLSLLSTSTVSDSCISSTYQVAEGANGATTIAAAPLSLNFCTSSGNNAQGGLQRLRWARQCASLCASPSTLSGGQPGPAHLPLKFLHFEFSAEANRSHVTGPHRSLKSSNTSCSRLQSPVSTSLESPSAPSLSMASDEIHSEQIWIPLESSSHHNFRMSPISSGDLLVKVSMNRATAALSPSSRTVLPRSRSRNVSNPRRTPSSSSRPMCHLLW